MTIPTHKVHFCPGNGRRKDGYWILGRNIPESFWKVQSSAWLSDYYEADGVANIVPPSNTKLAGGMSATTYLGAYKDVYAWISAEMLAPLSTYSQRVWGSGTLAFEESERKR